MLFNLLAPFADDFQIFRLFRYLTFRTGGAMMTALFLSFLFGPFLIHWLKSQKDADQPTRADRLESTFTWTGAPTMGGFLILLALCVATLLWADLMNTYVRILLLAMVGFAALGSADDYLKLLQRDPRGLPGTVKLLLGTVIVGIAIRLAIGMGGPAPAAWPALPFLNVTPIPLVALFVPVAIILIIGCVAAVNRTDPSAVVPMLTAAACFGFIVFLAGNAMFARSLQIAYVPGTGELAVFCGALVGASLGFLRRTTAGRKG